MPGAPKASGTKLYRRHVRFLATLLASLLSLASAHAARPTEAATSQARAEFTRGEQSYLLNEYERALAAFTEAYRLYESPAFLYNIGQCHLKLGHLERSLGFFNSYLQATPESDSRRADVVALIDKLQARLATQRASEAARAAQEELRRRVEAERSLELAREGRARVELAHDTVLASRPTLRHGRRLRWAGVGLLISALAIGAGGTVEALAARASRTTIEDAARQRGTYDHNEDVKLQHANIATIALFSGAGAVAVVGVVLLGLGVREERNARGLELTPLVSRDAGGLLLSMRLP